MFCNHQITKLNTRKKSPKPTCPFIYMIFNALSLENEAAYIEFIEKTIPDQLNDPELFEFVTLPEKCQNTEFLWPVFSRIWNEYRKIRTRKNSKFGLISHNVKTYQFYAHSRIC